MDLSVDSEACRFFLPANDLFHQDLKIADLDPEKGLFLFGEGYIFDPEFKRDT